jgi:hypothetical protein
MASTLLLIAVVAGCVLMLWASSKIDPHWVSKDGERMIVYGQALSRDGRTQGRWRELRVAKVPGDLLEVRPRRGSLAIDTGPAPGARPGLSSAFGMGKRRVRKATLWKVSGATDSTQRNRVVYLLDGCNDADMPDVIAIRLPLKSKAIPMLESMARTPQRTPTRNDLTTESPAEDDPTSERNPGTPSTADQPDPG